MHPLSTIRRRTLLRATAAASLLPAPFLLRAQGTFPSRPVKIIVPLPASGAADISARILGEHMQSALGQPIVFENKPGGLFAIGMQALTSAPADGYTLMHINPVMCSVQVVHKKYDLRQLTPVGLMGATDMMIMAGAKAPFKTLPEMIQWAKANPGRLNYGSLGPGSLEHLTMVALSQKTGFTASNVPFKGGPDGALALAQDEIHVMPLATPLFFQFKGRMVPLAVNRETRSSFLPEVPTIKELGVEVPPVNYWGALVAPAGTPPAVAAAIADAIAAAVATPELKKRFAPLGLEPQFRSGEDLKRLIASDLAWMGEAAQAAQVTVS